MEITRAMLDTTGLGNEWWGRAIIMTVEIMNKCLNSIFDKTPYELFFGMKPSLANLRIFGSKVFIHNDREG